MLYMSNIYLICLVVRPGEVVDSVIVFQVAGAALGSRNPFLYSVSMLDSAISVQLYSC